MTLTSAPGDPEEGVEANEEYRCVLQTKLDQMSLLYAPEVDCADSEMFEEGFQDLSSFVMVKCCKELVEPFKIKSHKR